MTVPQVTLEGIQEVMARNNRRIASMKPQGAAGTGVRDAIAALHRHAVQITHVGQYTGGGALKSSHRMEIEGLEGKVFIDPRSVSPRRSKRRNKPSDYGVYEHARGGEHAFYDRTIEEIGGEVKARFIDRVTTAVVNGE